MSTPIPVNNIQSNDWFIATTKGFTSGSTSFTLTSSTTASPFSLFACLTLPPVFELCCRRQKYKILLINLSLCSKCYDRSSGVLVKRENKVNFTMSWYTTFSFFPLFGIVAIHLANAKENHDEINTISAVTKLCLWRSISYTVAFRKQPLAVFWLVDISYGIRKVTWSVSSTKAREDMRIYLYKSPAGCRYQAKQEVSVKMKLTN